MCKDVAWIKFKSVFEPLLGRRIVIVIVKIDASARIVRFSKVGINSEWLFRLIQEPRRWRRIKTAIYEFPKLVYREKIFHSENPEPTEKEEQKEENLK